MCDRLGVEYIAEIKQWEILESKSLDPEHHLHISSVSQRYAWLFLKSSSADLCTVSTAPTSTMLIIDHGGEN